MPFEPNKQDLRSFQRWIRKNPHLPYDLDEHVLKAFLKAAKGSGEKAKQTLNNYFTARTRCPEIFSELVPTIPLQQMAMDLVAVVPLPRKTEDGETVILIAMKNDDPAHFSAVAMYKQIAIVIKYLLWEDLLGSGKVIFIFRHDGTRLGHVIKFTPSLLASVMSAITTAAPLRMTAVHSVTMPAFGQWIFTVAKTLLKSKLAERIHIHSSHDTLLEWFSKDILPVDLGGNERSIAVLHDEFRKKLESQSFKFAEDEEKLKQLDKISSRTFESCGTFKKLEVD